MSKFNLHWQLQDHQDYLAGDL